jgi:hypothetical protein
VLRDWSKVFDAGFVYSTPPHQMTGAFWAGGKKTSPEVKKGIMSRRIDNPVILINHWRWLEANGYKQQAASCKRQAASLTRKNYNVIGESRRKKYD